MNNVSYIILACHTDKGMKSFGSKGLLEFQQKKIFDYQIDWINRNNKEEYEIIIVSNFDTQKIQKGLSHKNIRIIDCNTNPIYSACIESKYNYLIFIDYGCLFDPKIFKKIKHKDSNYIFTVNDSTLDVGCILQDNYINHIYLDLPNNKFSNMFMLNHNAKKHIINNKFYTRSNLLYFETLNYLISNGNTIENISIEKRDFLYFKHMDQKNAINKFIKKNT